MLGYFAHGRSAGAELLTSNAETFEDAKPVRWRQLCSVGPIKNSF